MNIYDISKEIFSLKAYPGDPEPGKENWFSMERGDPCNVTKLYMGSHSGTHIDAPRHFMKNGKDAATVPLEKCMGYCQVVHYNGKIGNDFWMRRLENGVDKLLIRGDVLIDMDAAENMVRYHLNLIGVENATVGDQTCQKQVHEILLGNEIVILENLQLAEVEEGKYFLAAQPLKMREVDGSPVRAVLLKGL